MISPKMPKLTKAQEKHAYKVVTERDQGRCVRCGAAGTVERDHRQNRTAYNTVPSNLHLLGGAFGCGCHKWKTEHPQEAVEQGFAVPRWARPELWPAWRYDVGWVIYYDQPDIRGRWWSEITESTAHMLMRGNPTDEGDEN